MWTHWCLGGPGQRLDNHTCLVWVTAPFSSASTPDIGGPQRQVWLGEGLPGDRPLQVPAGREGGAGGNIWLPSVTSSGFTQALATPPVETVLGLSFRGHGGPQQGFYTKRAARLCAGSSCYSEHRGIYLEERWAHCLQVENFLPPTSQGGRQGDCKKTQSFMICERPQETWGAGVGSGKPLKMSPVFWRD